MLICEERPSVLLPPDPHSAMPGEISLSSTLSDRSCHAFVTQMAPRCESEMLFDPIRVLDDLPPALSRRLIDSAGILADKFEKSELKDDAALTGYRRLFDALNLVKALSDLNAVDFVSSSLAEQLRWSAEDFDQTNSPLERACHLVIGDRSEAEDIARFWVANRLYWSRTSMRGFEIEPSKTPNALAIDAAKRHEEIIKELVEKQYPGSKVIQIDWFERPLTGLDLRAGTIIQVEVKRSKSPERVDVEIDGKPAQLTLRFLSDIVILVDAKRGEISVLTEVGGSKFSRSLAETIRQLLYSAGGEISEVVPQDVELSNILTNPKLDEVYDHKLRRMSIASISYRRPSNKDIRVDVKGNERSNIFDAPELKDLPSSTNVFQVSITFEFAPGLASAENRIRTATIRAPHFQSYPNFSHKERLIAKSAMERVSILSQTSDRRVQAPYRELDRLDSGIPLSEAQATFGKQLTDFLRKTRIFEDAGEESAAWCDVCLQSHRVELRGKEFKILCRHEVRGIRSSEMRAIKFVPSAMARWLCAQMASDTSPERIGENTWSLGTMRIEETKNQAEVLFVLGLRSPSDYQNLNRSVLSRARQKGIVIVPDMRGLDTAVTSGWSIAELGEVLSFKKDRLQLSLSAIANIWSGRLAAQKKPDMDYEDFKQKFFEHDGGEGHFSEARRLMELYPDRWPLGRRSLANWLKENLPDRF